jgi:hypothetical protein
MHKKFQDDSSCSFSGSARPRVEENKKKNKEKKQKIKDKKGETARQLRDVNTSRRRRVTKK